MMFVQAPAAYIVPLPMLAAMLMAAQPVQAHQMAVAQPIAAPHTINPMIALQSPVVVAPQAMNSLVSVPQPQAKPGFLARCASGFAKASTGAVLGACATKAFEAVSPAVYNVIGTGVRLAARVCGF